jgi:hypothetical protein
MLVGGSIFSGNVLPEEVVKKRPKRYDWKWVSAGNDTLGTKAAKKSNQVANRRKKRCRPARYDIVKSRRFNRYVEMVAENLQAAVGYPEEQRANI